MNNYIIRALLVSVLTLICGFSAHASYPVVVNHGHKEYAAGQQNWVAAQTPDGVMLFGNNYGLLTFNGQSWNLHGIDYGSAVRSIAVDSDSKRVYAGGSNEFGYFHSDAPGYNPKYVSLRNSLPKESGEIGEIWNIIPDKGYIWFQADHHILYYDGTKTGALKVSNKITSSALSDRTLFIGFDDGTIATLTRESMHPKVLSARTHSRICSLIPLGQNKLIVVTSADGLFFYDNGTLTPCLDELSAFARDNHAFCATYSNNLIAVGTVQNGVAVCRLDGSDIMYANKKCGLQNNTVLNAAFDMAGDLWLCLDNGLSLVGTSSPIRNLLGSDGDIGAGYASMPDGARLLLGTNQGLFAMLRQTGSKQNPHPVERLISGQIWAIDTIAGEVMVSADAGLFVKNGHQFNQLPGLSGTLAVVPIRHNRNADGNTLALASTYNGFFLLRRDPDGWHIEGKMNGIDDASGRPVEDSDGSIWLTNWKKGIYHATVDREKLCFSDIRLYSSKHGFPSDNGNVAQAVGDDIMFITTKGIYRFDRKGNRMLPNDKIAEATHGKSASKVFLSPDRRLWMVGDGHVLVISHDTSGTAAVDSVTYRPVYPKLMPGNENFSFVQANQLIVGNEDGFFDIDLSASSESKRSNPVFVSAVYANRDSLVYHPEFFLPAKPDIRLPYSMNSVRFMFVAPDYESENQVEYSVLLEGYDKAWSQFSPLDSKEYTNLPAGEYRFMVKAFNKMTGESSECTMELRILPPWYATIWMRILYIILGLCAAYALIRFWIHRSHIAERQMEARKNAELAELEKKNHEESIKKDFEIATLKSQKLELDIKNKSNELSNSTLNLVRKNEILLEISERLSKLSDSLGDSADAKKHTKSITKIKELIRENISHDDDWKTFTRNFDLVYDNYIKRLLEHYPTLTVSDQRICAYIKMGLSSKEIAPLLNITYRSVEMSRYRIRKKMELPSEVTLADHLRQF